MNFAPRGGQIGDELGRAAGGPYRRLDLCMTNGTRTSLAREHLRRDLVAGADPEAAFARAKGGACMGARKSF